MCSRDRTVEETEKQAKDSGRMSLSLNNRKFMSLNTNSSK